MCEEFSSRLKPPNKQTNDKAGVCFFLQITNLNQRELIKQILNQNAASTTSSRFI